MDVVDIEDAPCRPSVESLVRSEADFHFRCATSSGCTSVGSLVRSEADPHFRLPMVVLLEDGLCVCVDGNPFGPGANLDVEPCVRLHHQTWVWFARHPPKKVQVGMHTQKCFSPLVCLLWQQLYPKVVWQRLILLTWGQHTIKLNCRG